MDAVLPIVLLVVALLSVGAQLRTVRRVGTAGLSASTWFGLVTSTMFWFGYGVATREYTLVAINLPMMLIGSALGVAIVRSGLASAARFAVYVAVPMAGWAITAATGSVWLLGTGGTVLVVGRLVPQLVAAVRAEDRSGISLGAWLGNSGNKLAWSAYGFSIGDAFVAWPAAVAAIVSLGVVALLLASRWTRDGANRQAGPALAGVAVSRP